MSRRMSSGLDMSAGTKIAVPPAASISRTTELPRSAPRAPIEAWTPFVASNSAVARPIPELPPVIRATLLFGFGMFLSIEENRTNEVYAGSAVGWFGRDRRRRAPADLGSTSVVRSARCREGGQSAGVVPGHCGGRIQ